MRQRVQQTALKVLQNDPVARGDDNRLVLGVCKEMGYELLPEHLEAFHRLPKFTSIVRARTKIQEQGRFLPPLDVLRERQLFRHRRHK